MKSLHPKERLASFGHSVRGIRSFVRSEPNAKIHLLATVLVIAAGFVRHLSLPKWAAIAGAIGLVWVAEMLNTAIEVLCDYACKGEIHPAIKLAKDIASGAVLMAAIAAVIIGAAVFLG